jgi:ElaB/YqjD/DUF883 family membrane-anchored ribosome-binding protein
MPENTTFNTGASPGFGPTTGTGATTETTGAGPSADPAEKLDSSKTHAVQAAQDLRAAAEAKVAQLRSVAEGKANEWRDRAESTYGDVRTRADSLRKDSEQYIRDNPTRAVLTALGIGFVLGLVFRR